MKFCFIPGYACKGEIFKEICSRIPDSFYVDYPLNKMSEIDTMDKLCALILETYKVQLDDCSAIIGHSLGGGVAMHLSLRPEFQNVQIVTLDYFLSFPPPFFRNYCSERTPDSIHEYVREMLQECKPLFNQGVVNSDDDYNLEYLEKRHSINKKKLIAIYGMRSEDSSEQVCKNLSYPAGFERFLDLYFIKDSAHFPMLENPSDLELILRDVLDGL